MAPRFLLLGLLFLAQSAAANVFEPDDRRQEERGLEGPFSAVVAITQDESDADARPRFGSGTLVGRCHVLTAHHVAFDAPGGESGEVVSLVHLGPPMEGFPFSHSEPARPVFWGDFGSHMHEDWALLRLERCLGPEWRPWALDPLSFEEAAGLGDALALAGHPAWGARATVTVDPHCRLYEARGAIEGWWHDCALQVGQSGGALYRLGPDGRPRIVAVAIGDFSPQNRPIAAWDPRAANVAVPVANFLALLQSALEAETRAPD